MAEYDPRTAFVPPGWVWPLASSRRLRMLPAEMFNRTFERAPDDWLHVAPLKRPPLFLTITAGVIAAFLTWLVIGVLLQAGTTPAMSGPIPYVIAAVFGVVGVFFLISFVSLLVASRSRASWGNRQCVAVGRSGIAVRFQGAGANIPWSEVKAVVATTTNDSGVQQARPVKLPILRIERDVDLASGEVRSWKIATFALDAAPRAVYAAAHFYWTHPHLRPELGTTVAQQRIDGFAGFAPATVGPQGLAGL